MRPHRRLLLLAAPLVLLAGAAGAQSGFQAGELIFYSPAIPSMPTTQAGILRIDPATGATSVLLDLWSAEGKADSLDYDPFRQRLIFFGTYPTVNEPNEVHLLDGFGSATSLGYADQRVNGFAPASGGRIYFYVGMKGEIHYLDASDQPHVLQDDTGAQPFKPPAGDLQSMAYDAGTNALYVALRRNSPWNCGGPKLNSQVVRLPLSADGTRVDGPWSCVEAVVDPSVGNSPVGLSHGPGGQLMLTVTTGTHDSSPRMGLVDPDALTWSPYAWNDYFGALATNGGTWSSVLSRAVIFDAFNNVLRSYGAGESGDGTIIQPSLAISGGGSGEIASLVEVDPGGCGSLVDTYCEAKVTSGGCVPQIVTTGVPSLSAGGGFLIEATQVEPNKFGLFFYGLDGAADVPLMGGKLCVGGALLRTPVTHSGGAAPCSGVLAIDFNAYLAGGGGPQVGVGSVVHGQFWFRDPAHPVAGAGLTGGVTFTVCP